MEAIQGPAFELSACSRIISARIRVELRMGMPSVFLRDLQAAVFRRNFFPNTRFLFFSPQAQRGAINLPSSLPTASFPDRRLRPCGDERPTSDLQIPWPRCTSHCGPELRICLRIETFAACGDSDNFASHSAIRGRVCLLDSRREDPVNCHSRQRVSSRWYCHHSSSEQSKYTEPASL